MNRCPECINNWHGALLGSGDSIVHMKSLWLQMATPLGDMF